MDCVVFADHDRRLGFKLMQRLRARLVEHAGQRDFSGVAGCVISIWFGAQLRHLPPKNWDDSLINPLLDEIADCRVDREGIARLIAEVAERGFPQTRPPVVATASLPNDVAGFVANAVAAPHSSAQFSTGLGFEVDLARQNDLTESVVRAHLDRLVTSHDKPQIQHLLITAGGPDVEGFRYPGEELAAGFLAQLPDLSVKAKSLQKVTLHFWSARQIGCLPVHH